jgi:hypothetical protein
MEIERDVSSLVDRPIAVRPVKDRKIHDQHKAILGIIKDMDFVDSERK